MKYLLILSTILLMSCQSQTKKTDLQGDWLLSQIYGENSTLKSEETPILSFDKEKGVFYGFGGCNQINGKYIQKETQISFENIASTRMLCENRAMEIEKNYLDALKSVVSFTIEDRKLHLFNEKGEKVLVFEGISGFAK